MPRDGTKNLDPVQTKEEAKKRGRNGGIASGVARREKRSMREAAEIFLHMPIADPKMRKKLKEMGFKDSELENQLAILGSMFFEATKKGSVSAAAFLRDTAGQNVEHQQHVEEFEYKKDMETGIALEMEDMDEAEGEVYGNDKEDQ